MRNAKVVTLQQTDFPLRNSVFPTAAQQYIYEKENLMKRPAQRARLDLQK